MYLENLFGINGDAVISHRIGNEKVGIPYVLQYSYNKRKGKLHEKHAVLPLRFHRERERRGNWLRLFRSKIYGPRADDHVAQC